MKNSAIKKLVSLRRNFLTFVVPEFFWPENIILDNAKIKLRGAPYTFGIKLSLKKGEYEGPERNLIRSYNLEGEVIIEMGGSIGILTAIMANKVGSAGMVISIEASQRISSYSRSWLEKNQNTKVIAGFGFPVAEVTTMIDVIRFDESGNSLEGKVDYKSTKKSLTNNSIYDIQKISSLYNLKPTVLVVDIEGCEKIILDQRPNFASSIKLILLELHPELYGESNKLEIINIIIEEGFFIKNNEGEVFLFERTK